MNDQEENPEEAFFAAMNRARNEHAPIPVIRNLLKETPAVVSVQSLHEFAVSCLIDDGEDMLRLLLEHEPEIARFNDWRGVLLHEAIRREVSFDTIALLIDVYPKGVFEADARGLLPLHVACKRDISIHTFNLLLSLNPDAAKSSPQGWPGWLSLHQCLSKGKPTDFILA
jgi:hypothetical protein